MPKPTGAQFEDVQFSVRPPSATYPDWMVHARSENHEPDENITGFSFPQRYSNTIGAMGIDPTTGVINEMAVVPSRQRQGIATAMLGVAQRMSAQTPHLLPEPRHGSFRTPEGDAWAKSTGLPTPPNKYE